MQETKEQKYNWNLQDIFKNQEEFNKEKLEIQNILKEIKTYQEKLCDTSDNLYNCYRFSCRSNCGKNCACILFRRRSNNYIWNTYTCSNS